MEGEVGGEEALCLQVTFVYAGGGGAKEKKNEGNWVFELCTSVQGKKKDRKWAKGGYKIA